MYLCTNVRKEKIRFGYFEDILVHLHPISNLEGANMQKNLVIVESPAPAMIILILCKGYKLLL